MQVIGAEDEGWEGRRREDILKTTTMKEKKDRHNFLKFFSSGMINVYKNRYMNKKKIPKKNHHRVINSSIGAVVEDDGIKFEMAIVTGTFVDTVDDEDETGIGDNSVLLT